MEKQARWQSAHLKKPATQGSTHTESLMGAGRQLPQAGAEVAARDNLQSSTCSSSNPSA